MTPSLQSDHCEEVIPMPTEVTSTLSPLGNKRVKQKVGAVCTFIKENKDKWFYICCHDNPDPDAISSAMGMLRIVNFLGVEDAEIVYCGEISHPQNRAMQNVLTIPIKRWKQVEANVPDGSVFIFVDCASRSQRNMSIPHEPDMAIDHHKISTPKGLLLVHDETGSCATLVTDLMLSLPAIKAEGEDAEDILCFDPSLDGMTEIVTALAVGIKTDTIDFRSETTTDYDFQAYKILTRFMSDERFMKIINYELPPYMFECEEIAWHNKKLNAPNFITGLRFVEPTKSDCIPYLADKYMRLQGIQTVVVFGIVGNTIRASVRTNSASLDCEELCNDIFGEGNGGAKQGVGGANVELSIFSPDDMTDEMKEKFWEITVATIERKFDRATQK